MPDIPFKSRLIDAVMNGAKPGTVRQVRKNPIKPGDNCGIVEGARTKNFYRHGYRKCVKVYPISIDCIQKKIWLDDVELIPIIRHWFAITDIQGPEYMFWDFFKAQQYDRPMVYICWCEETAKAIDQWISSNKSKGCKNCMDSKGQNIGNMYNCHVCGRSVD